MIEKQTKEQDNKWLEFLEEGVPKKPFLKLKPKPKTIKISSKQRRVFRG